MNILLLSPIAGSVQTTSSLKANINGIASAYRALGHQVRVISPFYEQQMPKNSSLQALVSTKDQIFKRDFNLLSSSSHSNWYIQNSEFFNRENVFDDSFGIPYSDNHIRFAFFASAVLESLNQLDFVPDWVHIHEWAGTFFPPYAKLHYKNGFEKLPVLFSIQDLRYDYSFLEEQIEEVFLNRDEFRFDGYEYWGKVSLLKLGILYSDQVSLSSKNYLESVLNSDEGLSGFIEFHENKFHGIQHGFDYNQWNLEKSWNDFPAVPSVDARLSGTSKEIYQRYLGFSEENKFLIGCVAFAPECRCLDVIATLLGDLQTMNLQLVLYAHTKHPQYEHFMRVVESKRDWLAVLPYEEHVDEIQALYRGADAVLVGMDENPAGGGIAQIMALGAVPIVNPEGSFSDFMIPVDSDHRMDANGFVASEPRPDSMLRALRLASEAFQSFPGYWRTIVKNAMELRVNWKRASKEYLEIMRKNL